MARRPGRFGDSALAAEGVVGFLSNQVTLAQRDNNQDHLELLNHLHCSEPLRPPGPGSSDGPPPHPLLTGFGRRSADGFITSGHRWSDLHPLPVPGPYDEAQSLFHGYDSSSNLYQLGVRGRGTSSFALGRQIERLTRPGATWPGSPGFAESSTSEDEGEYGDLKNEDYSIQDTEEELEAETESDNNESSGRNHRISSNVRADDESSRDASRDNVFGSGPDNSRTPNRSATTHYAVESQTRSGNDSTMGLDLSDDEDGISLQAPADGVREAQEGDWESEEDQPSAQQSRRIVQYDGAGDDTELGHELDVPPFAANHALPFVAAVSTRPPLGFLTPTHYPPRTIGQIIRQTRLRQRGLLSPSSSQAGPVSRRRLQYLAARSQLRALRRPVNVPQHLIRGIITPSQRQTPSRVSKPLMSLAGMAPVRRVRRVQRDLLEYPWYTDGREAAIVAETARPLERLPSERDVALPQGPSSFSVDVQNTHSDIQPQSTQQSSQTGVNLSLSPNTSVWPPGKIPTDLFILIMQYLDLHSVRSLRIANKEFADKVTEALFRSVVLPFGPGIYEILVGHSASNASDPSNAIDTFEKWGLLVRKFGISFEIDEVALANAPTKKTTEVVRGWFGEFAWPVKDYPRFPDLECLERTADQSNRMTRAFAKLTNINELAISVNAGHGWLVGPDKSDRALWFVEKSSVFGKLLKASDEIRDKGWEAYFENSQAETVRLMLSVGDKLAAKDREALESRVSRTWQSFKDPSQQLDLPTSTGILPANHPAPLAPAHLLAQGLPPLPNMTVNGRTSENLNIREMAEYPLIFSGIDISADVGGQLAHLQKKVAVPSQYPLYPNELTKSQKEWLMETAWAQRAFMSSWTSAITDNRSVFNNVHSLHLASLSSGLLSALEREEFFPSLRSLTTFTLLIIPDWRVSDDFASGEAGLPNITPVEASKKLAKFLEVYVAPIEKLNALTVGFVGGGEHAIGLMARNQHILPAPITTNPMAWLTQADPQSVFNLDHIVNLTFKNCWFTPRLLGNFMYRAQDCSLKNLTLDSCSLTAEPGKRPMHLRYHDAEAKPQYDEDEYLRETIAAGTWPYLIDQFTPCLSLEEQRYASGLREEAPEAQFRGNFTSIKFISCGYVKLKGMQQGTFNQNNLVRPDLLTIDHGLETRLIYLNRIMMNAAEYTLLGTIMQCMGARERRILERVFGMTFGWGDDMSRWAPIEDGFLMGGTGRFSGTLRRSE